jgi:antitoxin YefM
MLTTNATDLRKYLKTKLEIVSENKETLIIHRPSQEDIVMIPISEFNSWKETIYLNSTKSNRNNIEASIIEAENGEFVKVNLEELWK